MVYSRSSILLINHNSCWSFAKIHGSMGLYVWGQLPLCLYCLVRKLKRLSVVADYSVDYYEDDWVISLWWFDHLYSNRSTQMIHQFEAERPKMEEEAERQQDSPERQSTSGNWWWSSSHWSPQPTEEENLCWKAWDLLMPDLEALDMSREESNPSFVTTSNEFVALINIVVLVFHLPKINWKKRQRPARLNGHLSVQ